MCIEISRKLERCTLTPISLWSNTKKKQGDKPFLLLVKSDIYKMNWANQAKTQQKN